MARLEQVARALDRKLAGDALGGACLEVARLPELGMILEPFARSLQHPLPLVTHQHQAAGQTATGSAVRSRAADQTVEQADQLGAGVEVCMTGVELEMPAAAV